MAVSAEDLTLDLRVRRAEYKLELPLPFGTDIAKAWFDTTEAEIIAASAFYRRVELMGPTSLLVDLQEGFIRWNRERVAGNEPMVNRAIRRNFGFSVVMAAATGEAIDWSVANDSSDPEEDLESILWAYWVESNSIDQVCISIALRMVLGQYQTA